MRAGEGRGGVNPSPRVLQDMYFYIFERFGQGRRSWKLWRVMAEVSQFFNIVRKGWGWGGGGGTNQRARSVGSFRVGLYSQHANCSFVVRGRVAVRCPCGTFLLQRRIFSGCLTFADTYPCGRHSANEAVVMKPFDFATRVQKLQPYLAHSALSRLLMRHTFAKPTQPQNNDPATRLFMVPTQQPQNNDLATGFFMIPTQHATAKPRPRNQAKVAKTLLNPCSSKM